MFSNIVNVLQVIIGFGFVIFWHELGHFLAARWAGVRVEQFSVGMGHAVVSYRKGVGFKFGNTRKAYEAKTDAFYEGKQVAPAGPDGKLSEYQRGEAAKQIGVGETEYRIAWIPLGGYVKPTGQDDLRPSAQVGADDPYAYGAKPPGKRMVIIGAGVVMNVILAFFLYIILFMMGFNSPPAMVGGVQAGSPAQAAGLRVGDQILELNGKTPSDFTKILMGVALLDADKAVPMKVRRADGTIFETTIKPQHTIDRPDGLLAIGINPASSLSGLPKKDYDREFADVVPELSPPDLFAIKADEKIVGIAGQPLVERSILMAENKVAVDPVDQLDAALQTSGGKPVEITVQTADGRQRTETIHPTFAPRFNQRGFDVGGLAPRTRIMSVSRDSVAAKAGVKAGDRVVSVLIEQELLTAPDTDEFFAALSKADQTKQPFDLVVSRGGKELTFNLQHPTSSLGSRLGKPQVVGIAPVPDFNEPTVARDLPAVAGEASLADGTNLRNVTVIALAGEDVRSWHDINRIVANHAAGTKVKLETVDADGVGSSVDVTLTPRDVDRAKQNRYVANLPLANLTRERQTSNPLTAMAWGAGDTRDSLVQVYQTMYGLAKGSVPASSLRGPVGIFGIGQTAAERGFDWFLWFMALISANLAVVNFLPVPIVDGGLFIFLLIEKITGRPPSPKVQGVAQLIGLVLIAGVFLFVTFNDVSSLL